MKKYLYIINLSILGLLFFSSCEDYKEDNLTPNKVYFVNSGLQEVVLYNTGELTEYKLNVYKSGAISTGATVRGSVLSNDELQAYNVENETDYKLLDESCYTLEQGDVSFSSSQKDVNKSINIVFDPAKMNALQADYVLPVRLESSLPVEDSKSICFIYPIMKDPSVEFESPNPIIKEHAYGNNSEVEIDFNIKLNINKNKWEVTCESIIDENYVDEYNNDNGTSYQLLPVNKYEFSPTVSINEGKTEAVYTLNISGGDLAIGEYMLPVRLQSTSMFAINAEKDLQVIIVKVAMPLFDRKKWKILEVSSEEIIGEDAPARSALDGDLSTFWSTQWDGGEPQPPHHIIIDMGEEKLMGGFGYVARDHWRAWPKACVIEVSTDNATWQTALTANDLPGVAGVQKFIDFPEAKEARYFKLTITEVHDSWATAVAEIYAY